MITTSYLTDKFKDKYKISCEICKDTNDIPRKLNGSFEDIDCYISCYNNVRIFYYGRSILEVYIPSLGRGRNIIRKIYHDYINPENVQITQKNKGVTYKILDKNKFKADIQNTDIISNIIETNSEVTFRFPYKYSEKIIPLLKPKTSAAGRSPFSPKNLPKADYVIPEAQLREYTDIINPLKADGKLLTLNILTQNFINKMQKSKAYRGIDIKALMKKKMLKGKEFIHSESQWDDYLKYLKKEIS